MAGRDKVMIIDAAEHRLDEMVAVIQSRGYPASGTASADEAVGVVAHDQPDCIVLGDLPTAWDKSSYCRLLRRLLSDPNARIFTVDEAGADDNAGRWFEPLFDDVLPCTASGYCLAEMAVTLLTARKRQPPCLFHSGFSLDIDAMQLSGFGASISIDRQVAMMMALLMRAPEMIHSREEIRQVIEKRRPLQLRSVDVYIKRLRGAAKKGGLPNPVETIQGRGYRLAQNGAAPCWTGP